MRLVPRWALAPLRPAGPACQPLSRILHCQCDHPATVLCLPASHRWWTQTCRNVTAGQVSLPATYNVTLLDGQCFLQVDTALDQLQLGQLDTKGQLLWTTIRGHMQVAVSLHGHIIQRLIKAACLSTCAWWCGGWEAWPASHTYKTSGVKQGGQDTEDNPSRTQHVKPQHWWSAPWSIKLVSCWHSLKPYAWALPSSTCHHLCTATKHHNQFYDIHRNLHLMCHRKIIFFKGPYW